LTVLQPNDLVLTRPTSRCCGGR